MGKTAHIHALENASMRAEELATRSREQLLDLLLYIAREAQEITGLNPDQAHEALS